MPRDSGGVYSLPPGYLAVTGEDILASQHNPPLEDLGASMTASLPRNGSAPMQANLPMANFKVTGLAAGTASSDAATKGQVDSAAPVGAVMDYAGQTAPTGWLLCYGQAVSRTTYAALYALLGGAFGNGDGTTTFNVPDLRGRVAAGSDNMGGSAANRLTTAVFTSGSVFSAVGGAQTIALTADQNGPHAHGVTDPGHTHVYNSPNFVVDVDKGGSPSLWSIDQATTPVTQPATTGISIQTSGSGNPHNNVQPTLLLSKIIKV